MPPQPPETILVVDDDAGTADLERMQLERAGYAVLSAETAEEALAILRRQQVALLLLDYRLPGDEDGLEFYTRVKDAGFDLPVILVTGFSNEALAVRALRAGVRDLVAKSPEYLDYLPDAVGRVLNQVRVEQQLAQTEARLSSVIESAKDAIIITEADGRIGLFNPAAEAMFRCSAGDALGRPLSRFIAAECLDPCGRAGGPACVSECLSRAECHGIRADGTEFPLEASVSGAAEGPRTFRTFVVRDITDRKQAEAVALEQQRRLEGIVNSAMDGIVTIDEGQRVVLINAAAERMFGWRAEEVTGQSVEWFIPDRFRAGHAEKVRRFGQTGEAPRGKGTFLPIRGLRANGDEFPIEASITQIEVEGRTLFTATCRDVTERVRAEEMRQGLEAQFRQSQKMDAFGQLAGGVAHDFNNLLTVITGYSEILLGMLPVGDPMRESVKAIGEAGSRAAALTRQLLAFSRQTVLEPRVLDLNEVVRETEKMLRRLIGEDILLTTFLDPTIRQVKVDPGLLGQVLMNLAVNSRDAMPKGGKLTVETGTVVSTGRSPPLAPDLPPGRYVLLAVADTGCGMTPEVRGRIFEPFFTTKGVGKGTGLGLAVVHGIVNQSGGHIDVESEPGQGTTFRIYFPEVDGCSGSRERDHPGKPPRGNETILLVEDEEQVRGLMALVLQSCGYQVVVAKDGKDAVRAAENHRGDIALLLTDVVMPRLSGRELADVLRPRYPRMKVLYMSGYTDDAVVRHGLVHEQVHFLQKPITPSKLAVKVRSVLGPPA